ncbi:MAG: ribonuclease HII [Candidatus Omnitrophica bacterium]|nr:ribonuclease HII [Candidatus Omnitrophota bacterium]MBU4302984.1 ribonuclease HII [Candidatus Omnitrophota bacterium]MBU4467420.1 ribonuclease HII [Candidatus Omnitrophota bacterium]MCG2695779.1 ribonuclease HII [Candidatus Parcubacteria bacterium]MCG2708515.1 ribonuclease HII [Candidatus Omnitrophota bacterium]
MLCYERKLKLKGFDYIIGVDEAGRGPLAGPVVAAAVWLKDFRFIHRIDDSKKLTPAQRKDAFFEIKSKSLYAIAAVNHIKIDQINILQATILAMQKAISKLTKQLKPQELERVFVLIDGNMRLKLDLPYQSIVQGDGKSLSIAAASILAKVRRDQIMDAYHKIYPQYGFIQHKGYPTQRHREILRQIGPAAIHRKSFLKCLKQG